MRHDDAVAVMFANAVGLKEKWKRRLEGLTMIEAPIVTEWKAEAHAKGVLEGKVELLIEILSQRFTTVPPELAKKIESTADAGVLPVWVQKAYTVRDLDQFRQDTGL